MNHKLFLDQITECHFTKLYDKKNQCLVIRLTPSEMLVTVFSVNNYVDIAVGQIALRSCLVREQG